MKGKVEELLAEVLAGLAERVEEARSADELWEVKDAVLRGLQGLYAVWVRAFERYVDLARREQSESAKEEGLPAETFPRFKLSPCERPDKAVDEIGQLVGATVLVGLGDWGAGPHLQSPRLRKRRDSPHLMGGQPWR